MRRYIEQLQKRHPHEKRRFSLNAAAIIVGFIFVVWISTLGVRLTQQISDSTSSGNDNNSSSSGNGSSLVAAVADAGSALVRQAGHLTAEVSSIGAGNMNWDGSTTTSAATPVGTATVIEVPTTTDDTAAGNQ